VSADRWAIWQMDSGYGVPGLTLAFGSLATGLIAQNGWAAVVAGAFILTMRWATLTETAARTTQPHGTDRAPDTDRSEDV